LQTREGISENVGARYADRHLALDEPRPFPIALRGVAVVAGWLVPGAGHLILRRYGRAAIFFVTIVGSFALGLALHGRLYWPTVAEPGSMFHYDLITILWCFAQIGSGLCYVISYLLGLGTIPQPWTPTFEYGNTFMFLAGLLNYLVVHDAYDIAAGRKR